MASQRRLSSQNRNILLLLGVKISMVLKILPPGRGQRPHTVRKNMEIISKPSGFLPPPTQRECWTRRTPRKQNIRPALSAIHVWREVETSCFQ